MAQLDKPNLVIPLANTYNERGIAGSTNTITNSIDQRKVNCVYDNSANHVTGSQTLRMVKRPGVTSGTINGTLAPAHAIQAYACTRPHRLHRL